MTPEQRQIIYDWALIHEYAKGKVSSHMMVEVTNMDIALYNLMAEDDMPDELKRLAAARADPGCSSCWVSSKVGKNHPECNVKIQEWFDAREELITLGLKLERVNTAVRGNAITHTMQ